MLFRSHSLRKINRLPGAVRMPCIGRIYEHIALLPQERGAVLAAKVYQILNLKGELKVEPVRTWPTEAWSDPNIESCRLAGLATLQFVADARHTWRISALNDVSRVTVGAHFDAVKSLLYARSVPLTPSGRKRPILHLVSAHQRRVASGIDVDIKMFLRGTRRIEMEGIVYLVDPPQKVVDEMESERKSA